MKKNVKLVSALLILVMVMAQVVCVNAAVSAHFTISAKQVDHFEKEITVNVTNGKKVSYILIEEFDKYGTLVAQEGASFSGTTDKLGISVVVRPTDVAKLKVTVLEGEEKVTRDYYVGGNSYYNPGSNFIDQNGYYTPVTPSYTPSTNGTIIEWTVEEKEDYEVKEYDYYYVTCRSLNVRNGAGTWADKVGSLKRYAKVKVYDIEDGWAVIEYKGHLRYVSARYIDEL